MGIVGAARVLQYAYPSLLPMRRDEGQLYAHPCLCPSLGRDIQTAQSSTRDVDVCRGFGTVAAMG